MEGFLLTIRSFLLIFAVVNASHGLAILQTSGQDYVAFENLDGSAGPKYGSGSDSNDGNTGTQVHSGSVKNYSTVSKDGSTIKISIESDWDNSTQATPTSTQGYQSTTVSNQNGNENQPTVTSTSTGTTTTGSTTTDTLTSSTTDKTTTNKKGLNGFTIVPTIEITTPSQIFNTTEPSNQNGTEPNSSNKIKATVLSFILPSIILQFVSNQC